MVVPSNIVPSRVWYAALILVAGLLYGQLGVGSELLSVWTGGADACCERGCPCESVAEAGDGEAHHDHDGDSCPEEGSEKPCPPGCDGCTCCPGAVAAVAPSPAPPPHSPAGGAALISKNDIPPRGIPMCIFRPPKASLV